MAETEPNEWFYWTSGQFDQSDVPAGIVLARTALEAFITLQKASIEASRLSLADQTSMGNS